MGWTNKRLMQSFERRRDEIGADKLCYPHLGVSRNGMRNGQKCVHPKQRLRSNGWCECMPYPDVIFSEEDYPRWCREVVSWD